MITSEVLQSISNYSLYVVTCSPLFNSHLSQCLRSWLFKVYVSPSLVSTILCWGYTLITAFTPHTNTQISSWRSEVFSGDQLRKYRVTIQCFGNHHCLQNTGLQYHAYMSEHPRKLHCIQSPQKLQILSSSIYFTL